MDKSVNLAPGHRLLKTDFDRIHRNHISDAIRVLLQESENHPFAESTHYDVLLDNGRRLAPKAVLGVAARRALGLDVRPKHFRGGERTPCFRVIRAAGYAIVPKRGGGNMASKAN